MRHPMKKRIVIIAGATGLVGKEILQGLLADDNVAQVHSLGRKAPAMEHPKLMTHVVDFSALPALPAADEAFLALGTTIKTAGSQDAFRAIDFDANLAVAQAALAAGVKKMGLVSAMGANPTSTIFYSRVKGELEAVLQQMPLEGLVIARPSMLIGDRAALGQAVRRGEGWAAALSNVLGVLIPSNYMPIQATAVASALLSAVPQANGNTILLSGAMRTPSSQRS